MKRRTLIKAALGLPLLPGYSNAGAFQRVQMWSSEAAALLSGLAALDYALGGMAAGDLLCVAGPPATGKTMLLLDLATRICGRYGKNVVFWSAHQPCHYLVQRRIIKGAPGVNCLTEAAFVDLWDQGMTHSPAVVVVPSGNPPADRAHQLANLLTAEHPEGCAALVMDGWSTTQEPRENVEFVDEFAAFAADRWPHTLLSLTDIDQVKEFAQVNRLPVVMGVKMASLVDEDARMSSWPLEQALREAPIDSFLWIDRNCILSRHKGLRPIETSCVSRGPVNAAGTRGDRA